MMIFRYHNEKGSVSPYNLKIFRCRLLKREGSPPVQVDDFPVSFEEKGRVSRYNLMISRYCLMKREGSPGTIYRIVAPKMLLKSAQQTIAELPFGLVSSRLSLVTSSTINLGSLT